MFKNKSIMKNLSKFFLITTLFAGALMTNSCKIDDCEYINTKDDIYPYSCDGGMDVAFVIDYTGSMGSAINGIKTSVSSIVSTIVGESGGDYRLSLSLFDEYRNGVNSTYSASTAYTSLPSAQKIINAGAPTDQYLTMMEKFGTSNSASFGTQLGFLNTSLFPLGNGSNLPEPGNLILREIISNNFAGTWRTGKTKFLIIITDAHAGGDDDAYTSLDDTDLINLANAANTAQIQVILVSTLSSSNYELQLINTFPSTNYKVVKPTFNAIATDIQDIIKNVCAENK